MDDHAHLPYRLDRVQPQPAIHSGITTIEDRSVMPARIDPLDPDRTDNPQSSSLRRSRIAPCFRPA